jgi:dTDP-4-dehydrorhamnose reductase
VKRSVLILGASGMLGHTLMRELDRSEDQEVFGTVRSVHQNVDKFPNHMTERIFSGIDATNMNAVIDLLAHLKPEVVVNCIGVIKQDPAISDAVNTIALNALFPHLLDRECARIGTRLIHISTDCVFSGKTGGYIETDNPDPTDFYGRSKLLGEVTSPSSLTLRTSIIGHELGSTRSLLDWFLNQSGAVKGFTRAIYSGITTTEFADLLTSVIFRRTDLVGLLHVASTPISKYELLSVIANEYKWTGQLVAFDEYVCDRSLSADALFATTGYRPPSWRQMIVEMHQSTTEGFNTREGAHDWT